jgi:hypothetical protein
VAAWLQDGCRGDPADPVGEVFDRTTPALRAVLAMPVGDATGDARQRRDG